MSDIFKQLKTSRLYWMLYDSTMKFWWIGVMGIILFWVLFFIVDSKKFLNDGEREININDESALVIDWNKWEEEKLAFEENLEEDLIVADKKILNSKSKSALEIAKGLLELNRIYPSRNYVYWKTITAKVTAYTPDFRSCGRFADGKTSKLDNAFKFDGVAIAPKVIQYRSGVYIPSVGVKEADDTGSAMRKAARKGYYHIDVRMRTNRKAKRWGVRWKRVHLYKKS
ncbi:MAG: hypothetical protein COA79_25490 [Planctomycetota bacterium]|nr:MAG: hypothetical protein COA79_25490 [Planctomycetota bacterium]